MPPLVTDDRTLAEVFASVVSSQPDPPVEVIIGAGLFALLVVLAPRLWFRTRGVVTIAHEGGHALMALVTGRRVQGIRLHSDTSGVTFWRGRPDGAGAIASVAAGYLAPALLGLGAAGLLATQRIVALLWLSLLLLVVILVAVRNVHGVLSVVVAGGVVFTVSWFTTSVVQGAFAYAIVWFLLLAAVRPVLELAGRRRDGRSDADQLARLTRTPAVLWLGVFLLVNVGCLVLGARLLV